MTATVRQASPGIVLPFPESLNTRTEMVAEHLDTWAVEQAGLRPENAVALRAAGFDRLVGRMFPRATPPLLEPTAEMVL
jgi:hypothetical protein